MTVDSPEIMKKDGNLTVADALTNGPSLCARMEGDMDFIQSVKAGYVADPTFNKIIESPNQFTSFIIHDGLMYTMNRQSEEVLCIPRTMMN